jgi:hypothetical protein
LIQKILPDIGKVGEHVHTRRVTQVFAVFIPAEIKQYQLPSLPKFVCTMK